MPGALQTIESKIYEYFMYTSPYTHSCTLPEYLPKFQHGFHFVRPNFAYLVYKFSMLYDGRKLVAAFAMEIVSN